MPRIAVFMEDCRLRPQWGREKRGKREKGVAGKGSSGKMGKKEKWEAGKGVSGKRGYQEKGLAEKGRREGSG